MMKKLIILLAVCIFTLSAITGFGEEADYTGSTWYMVREDRPNGSVFI